MRIPTNSDADRRYKIGISTSAVLLWPYLPVADRKRLQRGFRSSFFMGVIKKRVFYTKNEYAKARLSLILYRTPHLQRFQQDIESYTVGKSCQI